ncbi:hypothetical protein QL285_052243 [Trifolium repens]|nr:hypothetical protein QL285_052243 [Trifolium repens]
MILSTVSLQSPGLPPTTGFNPFDMPGFIALLLMLYNLLLWHYLPHLQHSVIRTFSNNCSLIASSLRSYCLNLHGPLQFSTIIPCLPCTILSCTCSARDGFSVNSPDPKGPYYLGKNCNDLWQGPILDQPALIPIITPQLNFLEYLAET